ncbi:hypothetical protein Y1Q_0021124 [Alligator mississippiensis]|uniref:Uncharacterized protein n=1 Tax=Alligator mississippiensis TaxID=8496 RepID=A0A151NRS2_ALLMI|nr:hypothetical protein Y1Q_0021124 [Alligator mississippiensis]
MWQKRLKMKTKRGDYKAAARPAEKKLSVRICNISEIRCSVTGSHVLPSLRSGVVCAWLPMNYVSKFAYK